MLARKRSSRGHATSGDLRPGEHRALQALLNLPNPVSIDDIAVAASLRGRANSSATGIATIVGLRKKLRDHVISSSGKFYSIELAGNATCGICERRYKPGQRGGELCERCKQITRRIYWTAFKRGKRSALASLSRNLPELRSSTKALEAALQSEMRSLAKPVIFKFAGEVLTALRPSRIVETGQSGGAEKARSGQVRGEDGKKGGDNPV